MDDELKHKYAPRRNKRHGHLPHFNDLCEWAESLDWRNNDAHFHVLAKRVVESLDDELREQHGMRVDRTATWKELLRAIRYAASCYEPEYRSIFIHLRLYLSFYLGDNIAAWQGLRESSRILSTLRHPEWTSAVVNRITAKNCAKAPKRRPSAWSKRPCAKRAGRRPTLRNGSRAIALSGNGVAVAGTNGQTMEWIANRLQMGTRTHLNHLLYWHRRGKGYIAGAQRVDNTIDPLRPLLQRRLLRLHFPQSLSH
jgi:hypothetical protein